jgi:TPP-dependent pyruvate/acetoin dehydrogenase alpha subunit
MAGVIDNLSLYRSMRRIRRFEESLLEHFPEGVFHGTVHTYLGQEANAVGVLTGLQPGDVVFSNHRCHGHFLAYGGDMRSLYAELMGRATGVCGGRGGSQHIHWRDFYSNGVQGGILPVATGMALAEKFKKSHNVVVAFLGDGTLGEGVIYEAFNMASLWEAPILYVLENNHIAQTTPIQKAVAGSLAKRFEAFGIVTAELESSDVLEIHECAGSLIDEVRANEGPHAFIIHTQRFGPHSKGDDTRSPEEIQYLRENFDPLRIQAGRLDQAEVMDIEEQIKAEVAQAYQLALGDSFPEAGIQAVVSMA